MSHWIVIGLMFGDEGKGSVVDFLARDKKANLVVRFNGGAQARHHVVDGAKEHGFSQWGSGTFAGVPTLLSKFVLVNPLVMDVEAQMLVKHGFDEHTLYKSMFVDERCRITTPYHRSLNRLRELCRGDARHGSCGMGVGETVADYMQFKNETIMAGDCKYSPVLKNLVAGARERCLNTVNHLPGIDLVRQTDEWKHEMSTFDVPLERVVEPFQAWAHRVQMLRDHEASAALHVGTIVYEGAQGVLLDECCGFHPHTTWSTCTQYNALLLLQEAGILVKPTTIGVIRPYCTRHGPGPFPTFDAGLTETIQDKHNKTGPYQREFRVGWFDLPAMNYAIQCCRGGVDCLAMTNVDRIEEFKQEPLFCYDYEGLQLKVPNSMAEQVQQSKLIESAKPKYESLANLGTAVMDTSKVPIRIVSYGPGADKKIFSNHCLSEFVEEKKNGICSFAA